MVRTAVVYETTRESNAKRGREIEREGETKESRAAKDRKGTMEIRKGKL